VSLVTAVFRELRLDSLNIFMLITMGNVLTRNANLAEYTDSHNWFEDRFQIR